MIKIIFIKNYFLIEELLKTKMETLKDNLELIDLIKLRVHSDDLQSRWSATKINL